MYIKSVKVTNSKNVLVQIPKDIVDTWDLKEGDRLEVYSHTDTGVIIKPKKGHVAVRSGGDAN